ncbi:glycosyltransferase family 2 protein [Fluviicola taffensis]|uniref:Glycosyl transferase family 2 n=1 Tax=Fluviicola taffensis (strain DSM 16823 / NCIMB 13979 / RW262) TaxID=755732 RepID=F2IA20_FLUTR|nr:glycosyltransferase family 2 protein [Fluviicola taffensis]AEA44178.1 glycosyl transferase family 2 [Fluviicola taffensis DSM 16823]
MKIAVVIPCRNEIKNIEECIDAIYQSNLPSDWKLVVNVVDGVSNDGTLELLESLQKKYAELHIVTNEKQLTPFAFNLGIYATKDADYYQIIGARQIVSQNYLKEAVESLQSDETIWCVGGQVNNVYLNKESKMIAQAMSTSFGMGLGNFRTLNESGFVDTVGTPMYPAWVFEKIGYFDEELIRNQDDDFNFRVLKAGGKILYNHSISLKYYVRGSVSQLWKQFMQYGYWKVYVNKKHKAVTTLRQLVPPVFVLYLILVQFLFLIHPLLWLYGLSFFGVYIMLGLFITSRIAESVSDFNRIFIIFPILHISYGWGYLKGIVAFLIANKKPGDKYKKMSR